MKLYAPKYYEKFACIADKCSHSCCVGWEIDIDELTLEKYADLGEEYGTEIRRSIDRFGVPHFRLADGKKCPHLDERGLCRIITELGEGYLCDICREHPRFFNYTSLGEEVGLGMACEEACRLVLTSDAYSEMVELGEAFEQDGDIVGCGSEFDAVFHRERIYSLLSDDSYPYAERLSQIGREYGTSPTLLSDGEWRELISSLEYLDAGTAELLGNYSSENIAPSELEAPLRRALAYFVFRHASDACDMRELRVSLGFALFCERLLLSSALAAGVSELRGLLPLARMLSEEIEYSEDNTEAIRLELAMRL